jgi:hypothetical protein
VAKTKNGGTVMKRKKLATRNRVISRLKQPLPSSDRRMDMLQEQATTLRATLAKKTHETQPQDIIPIEVFDQNELLRESRLLDGMMINLGNKLNHPEEMA